RDWSSDVCSSDLKHVKAASVKLAGVWSSCPHVFHPLRQPRPPQPGARSSPLSRRTALVIFPIVCVLDPQPVRFFVRVAFVCVPQVPRARRGGAGPCVFRPAGNPEEQGGKPTMQEDEPQPHPFPEQPLPGWRRAVIKVGSSLLTDGRGNLGRHNAAALAGLIARFRAQGREVLLVSSGAV